MTRTRTRSVSEGVLDRSSIPLRIVKVGGSLFDWPLLGERLADWLDRQPPAKNVLIAGGGPLTDAVRRAQAVHQFDDEAAHWMCVAAIAVSARLLAALLPRATMARSFDQALFMAGTTENCIVFDPSGFLHDDEPQAPGASLPHDWTATSDSIAARVATLMSAEELVLLKSADPPAYGSLADLAAAGYVDANFPLAAAAIRSVRMVHLRNPADDH